MFEQKKKKVIQNNNNIQKIYMLKLWCCLKICNGLVDGPA